MRRLTGRYFGPCIRVRRDSDNATTDIGFTVSGDLNVAGLLAFTGGASGFVATWYDQMDAAPLMRDIPEAQPQIVRSGVLLTMPTSRNRPVISTNGGIDSAGGQDMATATPAASLTFEQPFARSSVVTFEEPVGSEFFPILLESNNSPVELYETATGAYAMYAYDVDRFSAIIGITPGRSGVILEYYNRTDSWCLFNGVKRQGSVGAGGLGSNFLGIGGYGWLSGVRNIAALYGEVSVFPEGLSEADQNLLTADQKTYWGT
ncbi:arabinofuranosidase catalytic domain-containing protein [Paraburkholderia tuberum]|uniref:Alpha-L-arabinofuranosidase B, catalytic n=1 Tax=Paraburkholderia tuberum TaxID=157910 RepID=A0A1H1GXW6_9BURK|nr:arabinofuranosidase catalytic domain-containing protein [Paraburkholderia tuberum]SDR18000.1 Alpha-L-arabinofuranosidase B, catalytic [Paraburkholderia tuberum]